MKSYSVIKYREIVEGEAFSEAVRGILEPMELCHKIVIKVNEIL